MSSSLAIWVGFDGVTDWDVEQTGVTVSCSKTGAVHVAPWYQMYPANWVDIGLKVSPGDTLVMSVELAGRKDVYRVGMVDYHDGVAHSWYGYPTQVGANDSSAEWVVENSGENQPAMTWPWAAVLANGKPALSQSGLQLETMVVNGQNASFVARTGSGSFTEHTKAFG